MFIRILLLLITLMGSCGCSAAKSDNSGPKLVPTIYYKPIFDEQKNSQRCSVNELRDLRDREDKVLATLCEADRKNCLTQGSCVVQLKDGREVLLNYATKYREEFRFQIVNPEKCPFGWGVRNICLDPFYTVAADLNYHKPGDVLYIPQLKGILLPDGSVHSGYFIVRDAGGGIVGPHRFDFYTGYLHPYNKENPFSKKGFGDPDNRFNYQKVSGPFAEEFLKNRNFPSIPKQNQTDRILD